MKKLKHIGIWGGIFLYLAITLSFVGEKRGNTICSQINVHIVDSTVDEILTREEVNDYIHDLDMKVLGHPVKNINIQYLEKTLTENPVVKNTEVYFTSDGDLNIKINQRNPIIRIANRKGQNYFIDKEGAIVPSKGRYTSHVLIANGNIKESFEPAKTNRINCSQNKNENNNSGILCNLLEMAKFINKDPFWMSQIEQIYVNEKDEYEIIPRVGAHVIKFGPFENYREKFRNLKAFYRKGLNNVGWNQYLYINLKYDNQIICTKR
ncbi:MAG: hypothetical protein R6U04_13715 [Bacteroidales bacterium]